MSKADEIFDEVRQEYSSLGLDENPFTESASPGGIDHLNKVFTGRTEELKEVFRELRGQGRKRILVYGYFGIGKTAFILEVLNTLHRNATNTLTAYISLPAKTELATAALIALARVMPDDEWAQHQLNLMGLGALLRKRNSEIGGGAIVTGKIQEQIVDVKPPEYPTLSFEDLLQRAQQKYKQIVIAIDDLEKQDPARLRELLLDAQGMLKGNASFILTGHPTGLSRELLTREIGLFDLPLELPKLDIDTMQEMLINYLNSARSHERQSKHLSAC
jgi:AAA ATPase domain